MATIIQKLWSTFDASFSDNNPPIIQSIFQISILNCIISLYFYRKSSHSISNENTFYKNIFYFFLLQFHPFNSLFTQSHFYFPFVKSVQLFAKYFAFNLSRFMRSYALFFNGIVEQSHLIKESPSKSVKFSAQRYQSFSSSLHFSMPANLPYEAHAPRFLLAHIKRVRIKRSQKTDSSFRWNFP